jgi:hypothetical protein
MIDIRALVEGAGVQLTRDTKSELWGLCPQHEQRTGKPDIHPSWSINKATAKHHCFSCGYAGDLTSLLVDLTGAAPADLEMTINEENFLRTLADTRLSPKQVLDDITPILTEWSLVNILGDVPDRLLASRMLQREAVDTYRVRWDGDTKQWVLPLWDTRGELLGAQYRQKGAVYTLPTGMEKRHTVFGYSVARPFDFCAVVESPLDAPRLWQVGVPAVALLGAWVSAEQVSLLARNFSAVYMALDNDKAGHEGTEILQAGLRKHGCAAVPWDYSGLVDDAGEPCKDVGDVPHDDMLSASWDRTRRMGL